MDGALGHTDEDTVRPIVKNIVLELQTQMFIDMQRILVYVMHIIMFINSKLE